MFDWSGDTGLAALFASAFVSATVLPGNSEIVLLAVLKAFPERAAAAIALATARQHAGRPHHLRRSAASARAHASAGRALAWVRRYGAWALLLVLGAGRGRRAVRRRRMAARAVVAAHARDGGREARALPRGRSVGALLTAAHAALR